jgi:hypothetical protein
MLTVHHLQRSQSERIVWLCEELGIQYELKTYPRNEKTLLAPEELAALYVYSNNADLRGNSDAEIVTLDLLPSQRQ